jgi:hypothetical protein
MTIILKDIHKELTELASTFNLNKPKELENYLEDFALMEEIIDDDFQMLSIDNYIEEEFDFDMIMEEEAELIF